MDYQLRHIRSFVLRTGRLTKRQQYALNNYWNKYGTEFSQSELDLVNLFNRRSPMILDIGTGTGDTTAFLASKYPENNYLAVEVHEPGIGNLLGKIEENKLTNIKIIKHDVVEVLQYQVPSNSLDIIYIFFPDPWPKKKHHKRRLINHAFLDLIGNRLKRNGRLFLATDWKDYAEHMITTIDMHSKFTNLCGCGRFSPRPCWLPVTRFEKRGQNLEHKIRNLIYSVS